MDTNGARDDFRHEHAARKSWRDPELVEYAVEEVTAGNPTVGDDGLGDGS